MRLTCLLLCTLAFCGCKAEVSPMPSQRLVGQWAVADSACNVPENPSYHFYGPIEEGKRSGVMYYSKPDGSDRQSNWTVLSEKYGEEYLEYGSTFTSGENGDVRYRFRVALNGELAFEDGMSLGLINRNRRMLRDIENQIVIRSGIGRVNESNITDQWDRANVCYVRIGDATEPQ